MVTYTEISVKTSHRSQWLDITPHIAAFLKTSGCTQGMCLVSSPHTTAGITVNENADPDVGRDFFYKLNQLVNQDPAFTHSEGNSDSHVKASLVGLSVQVPVQNGRLVLGTWQSVYFCEFDGPRSRHFSVTLIGE